jgi:(p)ppGpp synthase/HD superfamily hydrolase
MTQKDYTTLADAIGRSSHSTQFRNDGTTPYYTHPLAVEKIAVVRAQLEIDDIIRRYADLGYTVNAEEVIEYVRQVSKLHDVVEDTDTTIDDLIEAGFHSIVVKAVAAITKHPVKGAESYLTYLHRVKADPIARIVKLADLTHNMSDLKPGNMRDKYVLAEHFLST